MIMREGFLPFLMKRLSRWAAPGWRSNAMISLAYYALCLSKVREKVALSNMGIAFPDKEIPWEKELLRKHYKHLALSLGEYLILLRHPTRIAAYMKPEDQTYSILDTLRDNKKGAVILTAHLGNWEMLAAWLAFQGYPMHAIVRRHENAKVEAFVEKARKTVGLHTISKSENMLKVLRILKKGGFVGILGDQYAGPEGISLPFFGRSTSCYFGAAALAIMAKVPLVPVISWRKAPFSHCVRICPPLFLPSEETETKKRKQEDNPSREKRIATLTDEGNRLLEKWIREHPEQWLWLHRRYH